MLQMLKYKAKNQRTLIIKGNLGHCCSYTRQVEEITFPGGSTYDVPIKSKMII